VIDAVEVEEFHVQDVAVQVRHKASMRALAKKPK
jgi:hypothetical protein